MLGDADTIVTYLSHELGWDVPPPVAVSLSPRVDDPSQPPVEGTARRTTGTTLKVSPGEVAWISGVGGLYVLFHLLFGE